MCVAAVGTFRCVTWSLGICGPSAGGWARGRTRRGDEDSVDDVDDAVGGLVVGLFNLGSVDENLAAGATEDADAQAAALDHLRHCQELLHYSIK